MTTEMAPRPRIYLCASDFGPCGWYRMLVPGTALQIKGYEICLDDKIVDDALPHFDVFVLQRPWSPVALSQLRRLKSAGKKVVAEIDDDFWDIGPDNPQYDHWHARGDENLSRLEAILSESDLCTTSTQPLADIVRKLNPNVVVLPNQLPASRWRVRHDPRDDGRIVLGWAGTPTHEADLALLQGVVEPLLAKHPQALVHLVGMMPDWLEGIDRVELLPSRPLEHYPHVVAGFDIAMAPLCDTPFNRAKSDLKYLEYSMVGVPSVLSDVRPYSDSVDDGRTGFLACSADDWFDSLDRLVADGELRAEVGMAAHGYALERSIEKNVGPWEEAYTSVFEARPVAPAPRRGGHAGDKRKRAGRADEKRAKRNGAPGGAVLMLCPDDDTPTGGIRVLYRHVGILNAAGIEAYVLHSEDGFRCTWFANDTPVRYFDSSAPRPGEYLVIPEVYGPGLADISRGTKKVVMNQNCYQTFRHWPVDASADLDPYSDGEVVAAIVVSEDSEEYLSYAFPELKVLRITESIDPDLFSFVPMTKKRDVLSFMPRKNADEAAQVLNILRLRGELKGFAVKPIVAAREDEVAGTLAESKVFLSFGYPEGLSLPPLEAMAAGCAVVGYHGGGGREYFTSEVGFPIEAGDILGFARTAAAALAACRRAEPAMQKMTRQASEMVLARYTPAREAESVVAAWREILG